MFRWNLLLQTRFGLRRQQPEVRRPKQTVRPQLEVLEDRTLPSVANLPIVAEPSPQAASAVAAVGSFVDSMVEERVQLASTIVQYASNVLNAIGQQIIQEVASFQQQWDNLVGLDPSNPNPPQGATAPHHGTSATTTDPNAPNPSNNDPTPPSGNSGST